MKSHSVNEQSILDRVRPILEQDAAEIQPYGMIAKLPIALAENVCKASAENLNQVLADTITLRDMYKKHHWQVAGPTFYQLHLLYDKHYKEQNELVDLLAERIQSRGRDDHDSPTPARSAGGAGATVSAPPCARGHSVGVADDGQTSRRSWR